MAAEIVILANGQKKTPVEAGVGSIVL